MSKAQKQQQGEQATGTPRKTSVDLPFSPEDVARGIPRIKADLQKAAEILKTLPMLRRYGDDSEAIKECQEIIEKAIDSL